MKVVKVEMTLLVEDTCKNDELEQDILSTLEDDEKLLTFGVTKVPYSLTLTSEERKAIDWIGNRYSHGYDLFKALCKATWIPDCLWDEEVDVRHLRNGHWTCDVDITFHMSESTAWKVKECIDEDNLECFGGRLVAKLTEFSNNIV